MKEFRSGSSRVLIATDLLARGIDVQQVSLVINYDLPANRENYIHRIGRAGCFPATHLCAQIFRFFCSNTSNFLLKYLDLSAVQCVVSWLTCTFITRNSKSTALKYLDLSAQIPRPFCSNIWIFLLKYLKSLLELSAQISQITLKLYIHAGCCKSASRGGLALNGKQVAPGVLFGSESTPNLRSERQTVDSVDVAPPRTASSAYSLVDYTATALPPFPPPQAAPTRSVNELSAPTARAVES
jgi:hypothetical protein